MDVKSKLSNSRIGVIGVPDVRISPTFMKKKLGSELIYIDIEEFIKEIDKIPTNEAEKVRIEVTSRAKVIESNKRDILLASKVYSALKNIMKKYDLDYATIECFDLLRKSGCVPCLAVSKLIDEGKIIGCEAEINCLITMIALHKISGKSPWMGNFASFDTENDTIVLSHCTGAMNLAEKRVKIRSHFESGKGVSLEIPVRRGMITISRIDDNLSEMLIAIGKIIETDLGMENNCRTQIRIKLDCKVKDLIENTSGNHHMVVHGDYADQVKEFCKSISLKVKVLK